MSADRPYHCKSCAKVMHEAELRPVGDSFFCAACFDALMSAPSISLPRVERADEAAPAPVTKVTCFICKKPINQTPHKSMGSIAFCEECVGDLTSYKAPASVHEPMRRIKPKPEPEVEPYHSRATRPPSGPTFGEFGEKRCSRCERRVLEPNGYQLINDEVWCPICLREAPPESTPETLEPEVAEPSAEAHLARLAENPEPSTPHAGSEAPPWLQCDSCAKSLPIGQFVQLDGFNICRACESTDRDAALHLARARHRQQMIDMLNKLNRDG